MSADSDDFHTAGSTDTCPPFVFPQPLPDETPDAYLRRLEYWVYSVHNQGKEQISLGQGQSPWKKVQRITPSRRNN